MSKCEFTPSFPSYYLFISLTYLDKQIYHDLVVFLVFFYFGSHLSLFASSWTTSPALWIHSMYPSNSRSVCCCRRSLRKARRFSTLSLSLANSLYSTEMFLKEILLVNQPFGQSTHAGSG